ncbi:hypothetical protein K435DRAFT_361068 [Dendrothele bispora CBS 962.96]|uniref:Spt5 transcription elongation factor N-terminal domain-containing protein n=1 Tax=Dendrothele bispora (strain CBS 962.96) TaxID=1314807 RepID=A0A4S8MHN3_DENBC|nr:hypothetical protein K435DRAFT_361068 [Dendrothele bispora CBS 962.96]
MSRKKSRFILEEAEVDDEEDEETDQEDSNDELDHPTEWNEPENWQDEDTHILPPVDSMPDADEDSRTLAAHQNSHLQELHTLADDLEQRYVRNPACLTPIPLDVNNQVSNKDLRLFLLGLPAPSNIYRLKCKRGQEMSLVMDIGRYLLQRPQSECQTHLAMLLPPVSSSEPSRDTRGWDVVQRFASGALSTLPEVEVALQNIYGERYDPSQWQDILRKINDREDNEDTPAILAEIDEHLKTASKHGSFSPETHPALEPLPESHVYSAFTVPSVLGWIYLEAGINPDFREWLRRRFDVVHTSTGDVTLEAVEQAEVAQLLSSSCPSIEPFTWIRVTKGLYKDDIGLVLAREISLGGRRLRILLVPRLRLNRKRKSRCPQGLFNPHNFSRSEYTVLGDCRYQYEEDVFDHGLIERIFDYASVTYTDIEPDQATRLYFAQSGHSFCLKYPLPNPEVGSFSMRTASRSTARNLW